MFILFCCGFIIYAQDIITLRTGEEIKALIQEVNVDSIKYKKLDTEGPIYTILKSEVFMIKYANGEKETFKEVPAATAGIAAPVDNFTTGQRWGAWAINNFLVPGLGSGIIMKDWVGGSIMAGLTLAGGIFTGVGISSMLNATTQVYVSSGYSYGGYYETETDGGKMVRGIIFVGVGSLVLLGEFIFNIVRCSSYDKPAPKVTQGFNPSRLLTRQYIFRYLRHKLWLDQENIA
ncbi:hypothetical protein Holit_00812 [Hollandina sp. SP2]